jgi:hypothetical protein
MNVPLGLRWLLALGLLGSLGCNLLQVNFASTADKLDKQARQTGKEKDPTLTAPTRYQIRSSQFVFCSDIDLKKDQALITELGKLRDQVYRELRLPESQTLIQVHVFEDRDHYEHYMRTKYPDLPKRRAFFVAQPQRAGADELLVFTYWGERIREDLRHELTHAMLHSVLKGVPLWLDEGLAEYFEVPPECQGINYGHLDQIRRGTQELFKPDLTRLEQLSHVQQMSPAEYREAWAWVHLMLRGRADAKAVLIHYLQQLRSTESPGPLQPALTQVYASPDDALRKHLDQLDRGPRPQPTASR